MEELLERSPLMEPMSEDCLYLNVFSPSLHDATQPPLPVLVWLHGGSYLGGSGELQSGYPFYDMRKLAASSTGAVVVSVNYRLGVFGFLSDDQLLKESGTSGNMGTQDQRAALEFVVQNIAAFGGDPSKITLFGESAGAGSVAAHLASPHSSPLFSAGIMQSGGLGGPPWLVSMEQSSAKSKQLHDLAECGEDSVVDCLRDWDEVDLLHLQISAEWTEGGPCADGFEFPLNAKSLRSALTAADAKPMIVGTNKNESALFTCFNSELNDLSEAQYRSIVASDLGIDADGDDMDELLTMYSASIFGSWAAAYTDYSTDRLFFCDSRFLLNLTASSSQPTYEYRLDMPTWFFKKVDCFGVPHMTDIFYLFGDFDYILTEEERELGARMRGHWIDFATHHQLPQDEWPAYNPEGREFLVLDAQDSVAADWKGKQCELIDTFAERTQGPG